VQLKIINELASSENLGHLESRIRNAAAFLVTEDAGEGYQVAAIELLSRAISFGFADVIPFQTLFANIEQICERCPGHQVLIRWVVQLIVAGIWCTETRECFLGFWMDYIVTKIQDSGCNRTMRMYMVKCAQNVMQKCEEDEDLDERVRKHGSFVDVLNAVVCPLISMIEQDYGGDLPCIGHSFDHLDIPMSLPDSPVHLESSSQTLLMI
jgi:hypothetical protein